MKVNINFLLAVALLLALIPWNGLATRDFADTVSYYRSGNTTTEICEIIVREAEAKSQYGTKRMALVRRYCGEVREIPLDQIFGNRNMGIGSIPERVKYAFITRVDDRLTSVVLIFPTGKSENQSSEERYSTNRPVEIPHLFTAQKP